MTVKPAGEQSSVVARHTYLVMQRPDSGARLGAPHEQATQRSLLGGTAASPPIKIKINSETNFSFRVSFNDQISFPSL